MHRLLIGFVMWGSVALGLPLGNIGRVTSGAAYIESVSYLLPKKQKPSFQGVQSKHAAKTGNNPGCESCFSALVNTFGQWFKS